MEDTKTPDPEALDALLREHLAAELNPQLGRAARHFRHYLASHDAGATHHTHVTLAPAPADYHFDLDDVTLSTQTRDGGTVLLDGRTPARRIYRDELKEVRWVDPTHDASFEQIEPRRNIMLIEMDTY
jgi:hypothetical protein